jgi:hypothetical protein
VLHYRQQLAGQGIQAYLPQLGAERPERLRVPWGQSAMLVCDQQIDDQSRWRRFC